MRALKWLLWRVLFAALIVAGPFLGHAGAGNLLIGLVWLCAAASPLLLTQPAIADMARRPRAVPNWLSHCARLSMCGALAWAGWWWTATGLAIAALLSAGAMAAADEMRSQLTGEDA